MLTQLRYSIFTGTISTLLALWPSDGHAFFTSVKSMGMAGAVSAHPIDSLVAAYNPAGLAFVGDRWDLGLSWVNNWGRAAYSENDVVWGTFNSHHSGNNLFIPEFGVNKYTCECQFTWGFVIYNRSFYKTEYKYANPLFGTSKPGLEYMHYVAAPTGTLRFGCNHAIGVTIDFHGQRLKVEGLENYANDADSKHDSSVTNRGYDYSGGIGATIGWMSKVSDCVSIGISYSPTVIMSRFSDYDGLLADEGKLNIPQRYQGGVAIEMVNDFFVTFDIEFTKYNEIGALDHPLLPNFDRHRFGSDKGPGLGWMDQTTFRFGAEWKINEEFDARLGYVYHRNPIPSSQTLANTLIPNVINQYVTWGGSWRRACNEFSFYGAYGFTNKEHGRDSIPDSLGGGEVSLQEQQWVAGFTWGRFF